MKFQKPGALEGELTVVALHQVAEVIVGDHQLQPVTGCKLEGGVVGGAGVVTTDVGPLGHNGRLRGHPGRNAVFVVLFQVLQVQKNKL